jgi:APA family basic amino acid/polyamine antiporter
MEETKMEGHKMKRELGLFDGTMLVAGSMIGSGIFIVSSDIARNVGSAGWLIFVWVLTGIITLIAALSYGELSAMFPKAGGQYVYLREAYGKLVAFLYGWGLFAIIQTGTIAAVGVAFAKFTAYIFPFFSEENIVFSLGNFKVSTAQILAIVSIVFLTWLNSRGIKNGKLMQTGLTIIKILSLAGLIIAGLFFAFNTETWNANWATGWDNVKWLKDGGGMKEIAGMAIFAGIVSAMVGSLFSSDAWNNVTFIAGEIKNPQRNIGLSLFFGVLIVTIIYVLMNLMYIANLSMEEMAYAKNDRIAVAAALNIFGKEGAAIIAVMIMVSTFGCNNGLILSGARVYHTMAKDGVFFKKAANLNRFEVPARGLWIQCIWASALCLSGKYGDLLDYVIMAVLIFYVLTILGIFILRKKRPDLPRSYKAFGYPVLPAIYILLATTICVGLLIYKTTYTWPGVLIILLGIPIYYLIDMGNKKAKKESS